MSQPRKVEAACGSCGERFETTIWDSVNTEYAGLPGLLMSGGFFNVRCPKCGASSYIEYPMLYNDMKHGAFIQLAPDEDSRKGAETSFSMLCSVFGIGTARIVGSARELAEKVTCLEYGRDDRIVEFCKASCRGFLEQQRPDFLTESGFYFHDGEKECIAFHDRKGETLSCLFPAELYDRLAPLLREALEEDDKQKHYVVDGQWLEGFLTENRELFEGLTGD